MKRLLTVVLILTVFRTDAQRLLNETDTAVTYKERFYLNGVLNLDGYYVYVLDSAEYWDGLNVSVFDFTKTEVNLDTTKMHRLEQGKWQEEFYIKKRKCLSLVEYQSGYMVGKRYDFDEKGNLFRTYKRYPTIKNSVFNGYQKISYDKKGNITAISYHKFSEDEDLSLFWFDTYYNKNGTPRHYSYNNEKDNIYHYIRYDKNGSVLKEHKRTPEEWYDRKWNKNKKSSL